MLDIPCVRDRSVPLRMEHWSAILSTEVPRHKIAQFATQVPIPSPGTHASPTLWKRLPRKRAKRVVCAPRQRGASPKRSDEGIPTNVPAEARVAGRLVRGRRRGAGGRAAVRHGRRGTGLGRRALRHDAWRSEREPAKRMEEEAERGEEDSGTRQESNITLLLLSSRTNRHH